MTKDVAEQGSYGAKDYHDPPPAPLFDAEELTKWSFYRALIAEFIATLLFLYITVLTVIGYKSQSEADQCGGVGILGIAWAFGGMIFILVYCTAGISGEVHQLLFHNLFFTVSFLFNLKFCVLVSSYLSCMHRRILKKRLIPFFFFFLAFLLKK